MRLFLILFGILISNGAFGQYKGPKFPIMDEWFEQYGRRGLQVGDKMPDIPLGTVLNNYTGKKRFSEFRGKLIILDFWDTYCSSCIAGFPKMEQLQKEFGKKIQIILVNVRENEEDIKKRTKELKNFKLPDLPSIISSRPWVGPEDQRKNPQPLDKLFPTWSVPHHVWIDGQGFIRLRGGPENTYSEKIEELLAGKSIQVLNNPSTVPTTMADNKANYYQQLGFLQQTRVAFGSFITPFNNEIVGSYPVSRELIDSTAKAKIFYALNTDLLQLYLNGFYFAERFGADSLYKSLLYLPKSNTLINFVIFPPKTDTLAFTSNDNVVDGNVTTEEFIRSKYCYEQVLPWEVDISRRGKLMIEDLNRYFSIHYGIVGLLEKKMISCYELVHTSAIDTSSKNENSLDPIASKEIINTNGRQEVLYQNWLLTSLFPDVMKDNPKLNELMAQNLQKVNSFILLNGTTWPRDKRVTMELPLGTMTTIEELRAALRRYDLDIIQKELEIRFLVFRGVHSNANESIINQ